MMRVRFPSAPRTTKPLVSRGFSCFRGQQKEQYMRALIHTAFGDPAEVLEVAERPLPEPGPGQVRVRTLLSPIHNHDLWTIRGTYGFKPELPAASGTEAVGVVDALGEGVEGLRVGQRVSGGA